ncbi:MAG: hypothetical protein QOE64_1971 [Frankiales bacterium]|jgi:uncharacterized membrane protein|nr:hypothetical protein [Frankiales bacterium]
MSPVTLVDPRDIVLPSHDDDPVGAGAGYAFGGPVGRHARLGAHPFWTPLRVLLVFTFLTIGLAWAQKAACRDPFSWTKEHQYTRLCYSDVTALYYAEGLNTGETPYVDHPVEYPVVIGGVMWLASGAARSLPYVSDSHEAEAFFDITAMILAACLMLVVVLTAKTARRRPWDAAMVALAPAMVVHAYTNWDLLAAAAMALAVHAWSRRWLVPAGIWIAVGTSTKLYPALMLAVLLPLCLRAGKLSAWAKTAAAAGLAFAVINLPIYLAANSFRPTPQGRFAIDASGENAWSRFWVLNKQRPADWDSLWFMLQRNLVNATDGTQLFVKLLVGLTAIAAIGLMVWATLVMVGRTSDATRWLFVAMLLALALVAWRGGFASHGLTLMRRVFGHDAHTDFQFDPGNPVTPADLNAGVFWLTVAVLISVMALAWDAPRRPRLPQLLFLAVAGFLLVNKVDSPQYVIWLIPLAVLARPRWRPFLVWQFAELAVLVTRFYFFVGNDKPGQGIEYMGFGLAIVVRDIALAVFMGLVVRDIYRPDLDVVRRDDVDDPAGGVLDGSVDQVALGVQLAPATGRPAYS